MVWLYALLSAPDAAATPPSVPPKMQGFWLSPVGESVYPCTGVDRAWTVRDGRRIVAVLDANGAELQVWPGFDRPVYDLALSEDCSTAWIRFRSAPRIAILRRGAKQVWSWEPDPQDKPPGREVHIPIVLGTGDSAWVCWDKHERITLLRLSANVVTARRVELEPLCRNFDSWERSESSRSTWLIPERAGLCIAHETGQVIPYPELAKVHIASLTSRAGGRLAVAIPVRGTDDEAPDADVEKGLYVVDTDGHVSGSRRQLAGYNVERIEGSRAGRTLWLRTTESDIVHAELVETSVGWRIEGVTPIELPPEIGPQRVAAFTVANDGELWMGIDDDHPALWSRIAVARWQVKGLSKIAVHAPRDGVRALTPGRLLGAGWYRSGTNQLIRVEMQGDSLREVAFATQWMPVDGATSVGDDKMWLRSTPTSYLAGPPGATTSATLTIRRKGDDRVYAGEELDLDRDSFAGATFVWPGSAAIRAEDLDLDAAVFVDNKRRGEVHWKNGTVDGAVVLGLRGYADEATVALEVRVRYAGHFETLIARWDGIRLARAGWQRYVPWLLAALVLLVPIASLAWLLERRARGRRWLPVVVPVAELLLGKAVNIKLDVTAFVGTAVTLVVLAVVLGLIAPRTFRGLGAFLPFSWINTALLSVRRIRRRVLADFADAAVARLDRVRQAVSVFPPDTASPEAAREHYVALPASFSWLGRASTAWSALRPNDSPAARIVTAITQRWDSGSVQVLVEAAGGAGKSALLREVTERLLQRWRVTVESPLPIAIPESSTSIATAMTDALTAYGLDPLAIAKLVDLGAFVLIADNLVDGTGARLRELLTSHGRAVSIVVAMRPGSQSQDAFIDGAASTLLVRPLPLVGSAFATYVDALLPQASAEDRTKFQAAAERVGDPREGFSPLVLKLLAATWPDQSIDSLGAVYARACDLLVGRSARAGSATVEQLTALAEKLAFDHFWQHGERVFLPGEAVSATAVADLVSCGLLRRVHHLGHRRFFHDAIGSFLAARKATRDHVADIRLRAAGDPRYAPANAELLRMVLTQAQVATDSDPDRATSTVLGTEMLAWPTGTLAPTRIWAALPGDGPLPTQDVPKLLAQVVAAARARDDESHTFAGVERLYLTLAPLIWEAKQLALAPPPVARPA